MAEHANDVPDLDWCFSAVGDVSRTFALTVSALDEPMASRICVGYLLCRVADTVEDDGAIPPADRAALLDTYADTLDADTDTDVDAFADAVSPWIADDRTDDWRVVANADRVVRAFEAFPASDREAIRPPVRELVTGMASFVERYADAGGLRIASVDELEEYCWYAAGTVGDLVTNLLTPHVDDGSERVLRANAEDFALLLQLVNVAKDVRRDYREEDNVYLPATWLREAGVPQDAVTDPENHEAVAGVVRRLVSHAGGYADGAQTYLEHLPRAHGNTLAAWAIPFLLAVGTMRELRRRPVDVLETGDAKVAREEVYALVRRFEDGVETGEIAELRRAIAADPFDY